MHMHKSFVNATHSIGLDACLLKMTFWPCDSTWQRMNFQCNNFCRKVKLMHMHKSRVNAMWSVVVDAFFKFRKWGILWPLTPLGGVVWQGHSWLFWSFDYCLQDDIISFYFGAVFIFFMWITFFTFCPSDPNVTSDPTIVWAWVVVPVSRYHSLWQSLVKIRCREVCEKDVLPERSRNEWETGPCLATPAG